MPARSDIPYAVRLQLKKARQIGDEREDAASVALYIMLLRLNKDYGFGYNRLTRLARETGKSIRAFYKSTTPDVERVNLEKVLEQIGFSFAPDGKMLATVDDDGNPVKGKRGYEVVHGLEFGRRDRLLRHGPSLR